MLILPLHRSLSRANFPLATLLLILANVFVYAFLQSGDESVYRRAFDNYQQSGLGTLEFPAHATWLTQHGGDARKLGIAQNGSADAKLGLIESDGAFMAALHADRVVVPTSLDYAEWHRRRAEFDGILDSTFMRRHSLRYDHFEPARMLWAMFMHGNIDHIVGNMLFLAILGMLVEGALGPWWFLGLYLVGGIGAGLTTLALHWGVENSMVGASGAIAALMGAYCVIWGSRKVRVFYWFFVVFDYVKMPALVMLPFWIGWLVLYPWLSGDSVIDFDAHAGGIVCGAAIAYGLRRQGRVRDAFVEEEERAEKHQRNDAAFDDAQQHLGKLDIPKARALFQRIDAAEPGQLRVLVALYRCARYRGTPAELDAAVARVLGFAALTDADTRELKAIYDDYVKACVGSPRLAPDMLMGLLPLWLRLHDDDATESLLRDVANREPQYAGLPAAWFALTMRAPEGSPKRRARLEYLLQHFAQSDFAPKAQFLLSQA